jgi:filamentous hemagglutinin family protein
MPYPTSRRRPAVQAAWRPMLRPLMLALNSALFSTLFSASLLPAAQAQITRPEVGLFTVPDVVKTYSSPGGKITYTRNVEAGTLDIQQSGQRGLIESFNPSVGAKAHVDIRADDVNSLTAIRGIGQSPSVVNGLITANNHFLLINPNGIYVSGGAAISGASVTLSALDLTSAMTDKDYGQFLSASQITFQALSPTGSSGADPFGSVVDVDQGATLTAGVNGSMTLIGARGVRNQGSLLTDLGGQVTLVAAGKVAVDVGDSGFITLASYEQGDTYSTRVAINTGTIDAPNGSVTMAVAADGMGSNVFGYSPHDMDQSAAQDLASPDGLRSGVFNEGTITARGEKGGQGQIRLMATGYGGLVMQRGLLDVSAKDAMSSAGSITLSGQYVLVDGYNDGLANLIAEGPGGGGHIELNNMGAPSGESSSVIYVGRSSLLSVDATDNGNGGRITLSTKGDDAPDSFGTVVATGTMQARGGPNGGEGGVVETWGDVVSLRLGADIGKIDVRARAAGYAGGLWSLYSPDVTIGRSLNTATLNSLYEFGDTYIHQNDINAVLNTGGSVGITTYKGQDLAYTGSIYVESGTQIVRDGGVGDSSFYLQAGRDIELSSGTTISSASGKLNVTLVADADGDGLGSLTLAGLGRQVPTFFTAASARAQAQALNDPGSLPVTISTNGGDIVLAGAQTPQAGFPAGAMGEQDGVRITTARLNTQGETSRGDITITGSDGGVRGATSDSGAAVPLLNGVTIADSDITGGNISIIGRSTAATGVSLSTTAIHTDNGSVAITGVAEGGGATGRPIGVDIGAGVQIDAGVGRVKILGRAAGGVAADAIGLRINDLTLTTAGTASDTVPVITLAGQSLDSSAPGLQVVGEAPGIRLHAIDGQGVASPADLLVGGSAGPQAAQAIDLGMPQWNTTGRRNFRPLGVSSDGQLQEALATAIRVGNDAGGVATNFILKPQWFNPGANEAIAPGAGTVIGSTEQTGLISVAPDALVGAGAVTLQNQGEGSQGIALGSQAAGLDSLSLLTAGDVSQSGSGITVGQLNVLSGPQSSVVLTAAGNQISSLSTNGSNSSNGTGATQVRAQATPAATGRTGILAYSTVTGNFEQVSIAGRGDTSVPIPGYPELVTPPDGGGWPTDVYTRGQMGRPQVCTAANTTGAGTGSETDVDALSQEWVKVRRSAQLTSCSGVRNDSNCAAF